MNIKKAFTPKDTEELKPGFYVQQRGDKYKQILPFVFEDKWLWKEQLRTVFKLRTIFTIALIIFIAWSYLHDTGVYREFYEEVIEDPIKFCTWVNNNYEDGGDGSTFVLPVGDGFNRSSLQS